MPILFLAQFLHAIAHAVLQGTQNFKTILVLSLISSAAFTLSIILWGSNSFAGIMAYIVMYSVFPLYQIIIIRSPANLKLSWNRRQAFLKTSFNAWGATVLSIFLWSRIEIFFLKKWSTDRDVALFSVSLLILSGLTQISAMFCSALLPHFSGLIGSRKVEELKKQYILLIKLLLIIFVPLSVCSSSVAPTIMEIIFGKKYSEAALVSGVLLMSGCMAFAPVLSAAMYAWQKTNAVFLVSGILGIISITANYLFVPNFGATGASVIRVIIQAAGVLCGCLYVNKKFGLSFPLFFSSKVMIASFLVFLPSGYFSWVRGDHISALIAAGAGISSFGVVLLLNNAWRKGPLYELKTNSLEAFMIKN
jgi:O-antigen/teichoic acid export membrane protein